MRVAHRASGGRRTAEFLQIRLLQIWFLQIWFLQIPAKPNAQPRRFSSAVQVRGP
jgi:hypothetical protein